MLRQTETELEANKPVADTLNRLILVMQVVDDEEYIRGFCDLLLKYSDILEWGKITKIQLRKPHVFVRNTNTADQLLHRYARSDAGLSRRFFEKYRSSAFREAIIDLSVFKVNPKKSPEDRYLIEFAKLILQNIFPSIAFFCPDWNRYFMESVRKLASLEPPSMPDNSPETHSLGYYVRKLIDEYVDEYEELFYSYINQLSQLNDKQLEEFTHRIFDS